MMKKPIALIILDGYGLAAKGNCNAVCQASTPVMDRLMAECPWQPIRCSGLDVGLPVGQMGNSVTDVEIGGGKIQGREIVPGRGQIQFAMYNAHQYEKPEGHFTEQTSRDGEKWYKVYATTRVEKTPTVQDERGRMQYDERKVAAMPKAPARRH